MKRIAIWILGLLASVIIGGLIGAWLLDHKVAILLGSLAGAFVFAAIRLWR